MILVIGCRTLNPSTNQKDCNKKIPNNAEDICPILIGQSLPKLILRSQDNELVNLNSVIAEKPTLLVFFRGGWCPYCNLHLSQLQEIEPDLIKLGFQIIAISPDKPDVSKLYAQDTETKYTLLSDSDMTAAVALGLAFKVSDATLEKYKTYDIDLQANSGQKHNLLPVPAVFLIGTDGVIQFSYVNPNYKVRVDSGIVLKAAEVIAEETTATNP
jgi:peroxiredoxin